MLARIALATCKREYSAPHRMGARAPWYMCKKEGVGGKGEEAKMSVVLIQVTELHRFKSNTELQQRISLYQKTSHRV